MEGDSDAGVDAGRPDAGTTTQDAGVTDAGQSMDAGTHDAGAVDAGETDAGAFDSGVVDAGVDAGVVDAGVMDAGTVDAGSIDAGSVDAGVDAGVADAGFDAGVPVCTPNAMVTCYEGPVGTDGVGRCHAGQKTCAVNGLSFGACNNQVVPAVEICGNTQDDDCDGQVDEGCVCTPNASTPCYTGPTGTQNVGRCAAGMATCDSTGMVLGACMGETVPHTEACSTGQDEDCDGQTDEPACSITYANVQPIYAAKCTPCHTGFGSGGHNIGTTYADSQLSSYYCPGFTKGACTIVRIHDGTMPAGAGCGTTPNAPACVTPMQQTMIEAWIDGGQLE